MRPAEGTAFRRTHDAILGMIENSIEAQAKLKTLRPLIADGGFLNEFCTLHVAGPRQCGHTAAMLTVSAEPIVEAWTGRRGVFVKAMSSQDRKRFQVLGENDDPLGVIYWTAPSELAGLGTARIIFVDNAHFLRSGRRKKIEAYALRSLKELGGVLLVYLE